MDVTLKKKMLTWKQHITRDENKGISIMRINIMRKLVGKDGGGARIAN